MKHQFVESYYGSDNPQKCINKRILEGCWVIAAFGDAHYCTVVYEKNINPKELNPWYGWEYEDEDVD
jgi:hypothetical protein